LSKLQEEKISGAVVYAGSFLEVRKDVVRLPDGSQGTREYIHHPGAVLIVPLLPEGRVLLERQYRYPQGREFIEVPAGKRDAGEAPLDTAKRELLEETGYVASDWTHIGLHSMAIGYSDEGIEMYVAKGLEKREAKLDAGEFLEVFDVKLEEAYEMIRDGRITDGKTIAALLWVKSFPQISRTPAVDEEHFRLVTGFNDFFVVIACALLLLALKWIGEEIAPWLGALSLAGAAWLLAEFFTRKRRMALPSIVLLLAFVGGVFLTFSAAMNSVAVAGAVAAGAAWLHWRRFRVPITVAAGAAAAVACVYALLLQAIPAAQNWTSGIFLLSGIAVFAVAMRWDLSDTLRQTRKSDVAFWLHLLAAPLLVHPVFTALGVFDAKVDLIKALVVVGLYVGLALVSLAIDRRALMVSALVYVLYAFSALLKQYGVVSLSFATTALAIGAALLLLSAFWHPSRAFVLRAFPASVRERLAPLR
jgi:8-oxo-dGTP pyrophosphatase MutT (NUDIX family)